MTCPTRLRLIYLENLEFFVTFGVTDLRDISELCGRFEVCFQAVKRITFCIRDPLLIEVSGETSFVSLT